MPVLATISLRLRPCSRSLRERDDLAGEDQIESAQEVFDPGVRVLYVLKAEIEPKGSHADPLPGDSKIHSQRLQSDSTDRDKT